MSAVSSKKQPWFKFAAFADSPLHSKGFYSCPLEEITESFEVPESLRILAQRRVFIPVDKPKETIQSLTEQKRLGNKENLPKGKKQQPEHRFHINFLSKRWNNGSSEYVEAKGELEEFYLSNFCPELENQLNYGDKDSSYF